MMGTTERGSRDHSRHPRLSLLLPILLLGIVTGCAQEPVSEGAELALGDTLPALALRSLDGDTVSLAASPSHPGVVVITASGCELCTRLIPRLRETIATHSADSLRITIVTLNDDSEDALVRKEYGPSSDEFRLLRDAEQRTAALAPGIPAILVVDRDGKLVVSGRGVLADTVTLPYWREVLDSLLAITPPDK